MPWLKTTRGSRPATARSGAKRQSGRQDCIDFNKEKKDLHYLIYKVFKRTRGHSQVISRTLLLGVRWSQLCIVLYGIPVLLPFYKS